MNGKEGGDMTTQADNEGRTCGNCGIPANYCGRSAEARRSSVRVPLWCKSWTPKPVKVERAEGREKTTAQDIMPIDIIKELHRIAGELAAMIAQEQDDVANSYLVDAYDGVCATLKRLNEKAYEEFQENPS